MSYVRTEQCVTWYTTPAELRALAAEMEAKWATLLPGESIIVHQCSRGFNDPVGLSIRIAYDQAAMYRQRKCEHVWDGPRIVLNENATVATCSRCGVSAAPELTNLANFQRPGTPGQGETEKVSEPLCQGCGLQLAHFAGPDQGKHGLVCQTPGCDMQDIELTASVPEPKRDGTEGETGKE